MILLDANIFMYAAGKDHPCKHPSVQLLRKIVSDNMDAAVDVEVLQEILHRYRAIDRWEDGCKVFEFVRQVVPQVLPVTDEIMQDTYHLLHQYPTLSARDALHAAVYRTYNAIVFCSYDTDFDVITNLNRCEPGDL